MSRARTIANYGDGLEAGDIPSLAASKITSGTLGVARGGTGAATHTSANVLIGAGTSAFTSIAPGADGQVLTSTGSAWNSEAAAGAGEVAYANLPTGTVLQIVTSRVDGGSRGHNTKAISARSEIHADYRASIIPKETGSKIIVRYSSRNTYLADATANFAFGYEVTASGGTATASTLKDNLTSGANDDEDSYWTTFSNSGGYYHSLTIEDAHSPSYTAGQKIWYGIISWATDWHYFELNGDVTQVITEVAG